MWWSRRGVLSALAAGTLAACGFSPAYAPGGPAAALADRVAVQAPRTGLEYTLVARLEQRLGRASDGAPFALAFTLRTGQEAVAITPAAEITRFNVLGSIDWRLIDTASGTVAASGQVRSFTSYSATGSTIATRAARDDALDRLMKILADRTADEVVLKAAAPR
jgi:LPS-assembly lipoprotein